MPNHRRGTLVIIGGHEDREGEKVILREVARHVGDGKLVVATVASEEPDGLFDQYKKAFRDLGVKQVAELPVAQRSQAREDATVKILDGARGVFFTGGDQLKITSQIGDTPTYRRIQEIHREEGGVIADTSAGASMMCETMLVSGGGDESATVGETVQMAPGLGFVGGVVIDQHFAERGRMGRLLGAVAQNPKSLGLGIDEDTAIVVSGHTFSVIGKGSVYVLDGSTVTWSNVAEGEAENNLGVHDVRMHVLAAGDRFDLRGRRPLRRPEKAESGEKKEKVSAS